MSAERCCACAAELMRQIAECEFTLIDINLYLDTHPNDERAIADYNCYSHQLMMLKHRYVAEYGPLENFGNSENISETEFLWQSQKFPWQWIREA